MRIFIKKFLFPTLFFALTFILIAFYTKNNAQKPKDKKYIIKSYKNTIALYNNDEIVEIYDSIVLNTLPQNDIKKFNDGITVSTQAQAEKYLENFD